MKLKQLLMMIAMLPFAIGAHAIGGSVIVTGTEDLFKTAIEQNTDVKLDGNIELTDVLVIPAGKEIAINLNGFTLSRDLTAFSDGGGIFRVEAGAKVRIFDDSADKKGTIKDGMATRGGAILNYGELEIRDITITGCSASLGGGAIYNAAPANKDEYPNTRLTMTNVTFTQNVSEVNDGSKGMGGSVYNEAGCIVTMTDCTFQNGNARLGGAIYNEGSLTLTKCVVSSNQAASGGGIYNQKGVLTMNEGFIRDNRAHSGVGGGAVNAAEATFDMRGGTVTKNTSQNVGGGVWSEGTIKMQGVIDITENLSSNNTGNYSDGGKNGNLYLFGSNKVDIMGKLQETVEGTVVESKIGLIVSKEGFITKNYHENTGETTIKYFIADDPDNYELTWFLMLTQEQIESEALSGMKNISRDICMYHKKTDGTSWTYFAEKPTKIDGSVVYIEKPEHLAWLAKIYQDGDKDYMDKEFRQMADFDFSMHKWIPIGTNEHHFIGNYYGNGYVITGIRCDLSGMDNVGLFGSMGDDLNHQIVRGTINDVILLNSKIVGRNNVGGICGYAHAGTISHCVTDAEVEGQETVGGIVGLNGDDIEINGIFELEFTTTSVHTCLYTGSKITSKGGKYCSAIIGRNLMYRPSMMFNNYYTNSMLDSKSDTDVRAYPVYNNIKDVTLGFDPGVAYASYQYIPKGTVKLTVDTGGDYMQVNSFSFNGRPIGTGAGTYEVSLQGDEEEALITGETELKTLAGEGTEQSPYQINSVTDWNVLAAQVARGNTYKGKVVRLMQGMTVSTMVGTEEYPFEGTFNGGGNLLAFKIGSSKEEFQEQYCAPFRYYAGPLITDFDVEGEIYTSGQMAAGIVGQLFPAATGSEQTAEFRNCISRITIFSSLYGEAYHGGLVGEKNGSENTVKFSFCAFIGGFNGEDTDACSGFIGSSDWSDKKDNNGASFEYCLYSPSSFSVKTNRSAAFSNTQVASAKKLFVSNKSYAPNDKLIADLVMYQYSWTDDFFGKKLVWVKDVEFFERAIGVYNSYRRGWWSTVSLYNEMSNEDRINADNGKTIDVCLQGHSLVKDGMLHGLYFPFGASLTSGPLVGATAFKMTGSTLTDNKLNVTFEKVTGETLEAGVPYLVKYGDDGTVINNPVFEQVTISKTDHPAEDANIGFYGAFSYKELSDGELENSYFIDNNQLYESVFERYAFDTYLKVLTTSNVSDITVTAKGDGADIVMTMMTGLSGEGTAEKPFLIRNVGDWEWLADKVELGETYSGKEFRLVKNITTGVPLGTVGTVDDKEVEHFFEGNFDGDGNTLTFIVSQEDVDVNNYDFAAPFRYYGGTAIKNLTVEGTISSGKKSAAGLVGALFNVGDNKTLDITDCRVSATLQSTYNETSAMEAFFGGFVGQKRGEQANLNFTRCVFDGELLGEYVSHCSGFVGYTLGAKRNVSLKDCLLAPKTVTVQTTGSYAFVESGPASITNTYYTDWAGEKQGAESFVFSSENNSFGAVSGSNDFMKAYAKAILYNDKYYASLPWEGEGTESTPYLIKTPEQLQDMQALLSGSEAARIGNYFKQAANLEFDKNTTNNFTPFATFTRHYDGDGYVISGLNIGTSDNGRAALFLEAGENSTVKNVIIQNSDFWAPYAAPVVAMLTGNATVENCHVLKNVTATSDLYCAGGVVASMKSENAKVIGCSSFASAVARGTVGGIVGNVVSGRLSNSIYLGNSLRCNQMRGAVSAHYPADTPAENCYFTTSSLSDPLARLMAKEDAVNTDFLTLINTRDEYLKEAKAALAVSDYNYDLTLNGRTFYHDGNWNVLSLPFGMSDFAGTPLAGATIKTLDASSFADGKLTLTFSDATSIEAGKPYFVKWESGSNVVNPTFSNVTVTATEGAAVETTNVNFKGILSPVGLTADDRSVLFLGKDNKLYYPNSNVIVGSYRAYFLLQGITAGDLANGARSIELDFGDGTTGINDVRGKMDEVSGEYYELSGRRVTRPAKGVYIVNGRKVVIK